MLKQAQIYFLVLLIGFQSFGIFAIYPFIEATCKFVMHFESSENEEESIHLNSLSDLSWHNSHEVYINGKICDVVNIKADDNTFVLTYVADEMETAFLHVFEEMGLKIMKLIQLFMKGLLSVELFQLNNPMIFLLKKYVFYSLKIIPQGIDASNICFRTILSPPPQNV